LDAVLGFLNDRLSMALERIRILEPVGIGHEWLIILDDDHDFDETETRILSWAPLFTVLRGLKLRTGIPPDVTTVA
jgi:hypothetical protein